MDKFTALAAPIRREIISLLASSGELTATAIAEKFMITPSAISQHLKVLLESDLVQVQRQAQQRIYVLNPAAVTEMEHWLEQLVRNISPFTTKPVEKHRGMI